MADEENVNKEEQQEESKAPEKEEKQEPSWQEIAGVDPKEFDDPVKLAKSYKDSRKGLSEQGEKLKEAEQFRQQATPVLQTIYGNPDLYKKVVEAMTPKEEEEAKKSTTEPQPDPRVDEIQGMEETRVIADFEKESGINDLSDEEKEKARKEVGAIMQRWIPKGSRPSLQQLPVYLKDAWKIYSSENDVKPKQDKPDLTLGFGTPRAAQAAIEKMGVDSLSPEERKAAERMGLTVEDYLKEKKEIVSS